MRTEMPMPICADDGAEKDTTETVNTKILNTNADTNLRMERVISFPSLWPCVFGPCRLIWRHYVPAIETLNRAACCGRTKAILKMRKLAARQEHVGADAGVRPAGPSSADAKSGTWVLGSERHRESSPSRL